MEDITVFIKTPLTEEQAKENKILHISKKEGDQIHFTCYICRYSTPNENHFYKHFNTKKHVKRRNGNLGISLNDFDDSESCDRHIQKIYEEIKQENIERRNNKYKN